MLIDADEVTDNAFVWKGFSSDPLRGGIISAGDAGIVTQGKNIEFVYGGTDGVTAKHYTNGVYIGVTALQYNSPFTTIGRGDGAFYWLGTLKEFVIWTNAVNTPFSAADIAQIHRYVTNTYNPSTFQ